MDSVLACPLQCLYIADLLLKSVILDYNMVGRKMNRSF